MKTRSKTKSTKGSDEVLTSTSLQKALSSKERSRKWRPKLYKDPKHHNDLKKTDQTRKALVCGAEKKTRKHDDRVAIIYREKVNLIYQIS